MKEKEIRSFNTEFENADDYTIKGYIVKYNTRSQFMGFYEEIQKQAFDNALKRNNDIRALYNHDVQKILGRQNVNLQLRSDDIGLAFELRLNPEITYQKDLYGLVKEGIVTGCSFGFRCLDDEWSHTSEGKELRTVKDADLFEVSIVANPAYLSSEASCRSYEDMKKNEIQKKKNEIELELLNL